MVFWREGERVGTLSLSLVIILCQIVGLPVAWFITTIWLSPNSFSLFTITVYFLYCSMLLPHFIYAVNKEDAAGYTLRE